MCSCAHVRIKQVTVQRFHSEFMHVIMSCLLCAPPGRQAAKTMCGIFSEEELVSCYMPLVNVWTCLLLIALAS